MYQGVLVDNFNAYSVPIGDLPVGKHEFEFEVNDEFFAHFEGSEVLSAAVRVCLDVEKSSEVSHLLFGMEGTATVECDRCLDELELPVEFDGELMVYLSTSPTVSKGEEEMEEDDTVFLLAGESNLNLAQYIYESICLSLPMQRVHLDDEHGNTTCNPEMVAKLKELQGEAQQIKEANSPWSKLKNL
ncbi:MAG: DUF177 domain-containing protein [Prevotellaceae bacterium]|nr:DUF177 domain-containing protein [Prevotellaceae bacterium]